jgi:Xaa-Pro dipeptidase
MTNATIAQFIQRQTRLSQILLSEGLDGLALNPSPSLAYLTGLHFHLMERPVLALFTPGNPPRLVTPELEAAKTADLPYPAEVILYGEDPAKWPAAFEKALHSAGLQKAKIGVEPTWLRFLELRLLEKAAPQASFVSAESALTDLRVRKDENELACMRKAARIAQKALLETLPQVSPGITERALASELTLNLLRAGSDPQFPFSPIVSGGPNSANPHASPSDRPLQAGDLLVIDWGATYGGYISDITRTFAIGPVDEEYRRIAELVLQANQAGFAAVRPGQPCQAIDQAARQVIEKGGYGEYFTHRTGHGLGMEGHEPPYMRAGNLTLLEVGMTFTIEPGIYLPGRNGVRIEDDVVVTEHGAESLTDLPRQLQEIGQ